MDGRKVKIVKSEEPESTEILADSIVRISDGFRELQASGLNRRGLVTLLHDSCRGNVSKKQITTVLENLPRLKGYYVRQA